MAEDVEAQARACWDRGDHDGVVTTAVQAYGEEVFSFLIVRLRNEDDAADVFAQASETLLRTMPEFEWRCSLRTWFYRLARSAAARHERQPLHRKDRRVSLSQVSEAVAHARSRTMAHLRSEVKDGVRALRERLDAEEQQLLVLRVDRALDWNEIAEIMADDDLDDDAKRRASARLRQRFQTLKERLRALAIEEGLLDAE
ncbi:MAG TPA: sigma-70 family RNA polymerase sigma factor [Kofleriaceae bacterium]|nr:sigma-70 family RNA polymerase sigma factor [Kofleriaceae bacterium]